MKYLMFFAAILALGCNQHSERYALDGTSHREQVAGSNAKPETVPFSSADYFNAEIDAEPADKIKIGDPRESVEQMIRKYKGIPSRIAYSKSRNGKRVIANPELSYSFNRLTPILMISLADNIVTEIDFGIPSDSESSDDIKKGYTIESVESFSFFEHYSRDRDRQITK